MSRHKVHVTWDESASEWEIVVASPAVHCRAKTVDTVEPVALHAIADALGIDDLASIELLVSSSASAEMREL